MSMKFRPVLRKNPRKLSDPGKFYPNPVYRGKATFRDVSNAIAGKTSLSSTDCLAVLEALTAVLPEFLSEGYIVYLNDFGTLRLTIKGDGSPTKQQVKASSIKSIRVNFLPGKELMEGLKSTKPELEKGKVTPVRKKK